MVIQESKEFLTSDEKKESILNNILAIIKYNVEDVAWVGYYWKDNKKDSLYLGAFQGKVACMHIDIDKGVCGKSFREDRALAVGDVNKFDGHIACDSETKSELVLPIHKDGKPIGVLDIDSNTIHRFKNENIGYFNEIIKVIEEVIERE